MKYGRFSARPRAIVDDDVACVVAVSVNNQSISAGRGYQWVDAREIS